MAASRRRLAETTVIAGAARAAAWRAGPLVPHVHVFDSTVRRLSLVYRIGVAAIAGLVLAGYLVADRALDRWERHIELHPAELPRGEGERLALFRLLSQVSAGSIAFVLLGEAFFVFRPGLARLRREHEALGRAAVEHRQALDAAREAEARLAESEMRFRSSFDSAAIGMALLSIDGRFLEVNAALCELLGYSAEELIGMDVRAVTHPDDLAHSLAQLRAVAEADLRCYGFDKRYVGKDGRALWVTQSVGVVRDQAQHPLYAVAQIEDITARKRAEEDVARYASELRSLALTDELTGLHNRRGFRSLAAQVCAKQHRSPQALMLVAADLNHLKTINDSFGHEAGDRAILLVASALSSTFRTSDILGRVGGDEFLCLLPDASEFDEQQVRERFEARLARLMGDLPQEFPVGATLGVVTVAPFTAVELDALIREADQAMYAGKRARPVARG